MCLVGDFYWYGMVWQPIPMFGFVILHWDLIPKWILIPFHSLKSHTLLPPKFQTPFPPYTNPNSKSLKFTSLFFNLPPPPLKFTSPSTFGSSVLCSHRWPPAPAVLRFPFVCFSFFIKRLNPLLLSSSFLPPTQRTSHHSQPRLPTTSWTPPASSAYRYPSTAGSSSAQQPQGPLYARLFYLFPICMSSSLLN